MRINKSYSIVEDENSKYYIKYKNNLLCDMYIDNYILLDDINDIIVIQYDDIVELIRGSIIIKQLSYCKKIEKDPTGGFIIYFQDTKTKYDIAGNMIRNELIRPSKKTGTFVNVVPLKYKLNIITTQDGSKITNKETNISIISASKITKTKYDDIVKVFKNDTFKLYNILYQKYINDETYVDDKVSDFNGDFIVVREVGKLYKVVNCYGKTISVDYFDKVIEVLPGKFITYNQTFGRYSLVRNNGRYLYKDCILSYTKTPEKYSLMMSNEVIDIFVSEPVQSELFKIPEIDNLKIVDYILE